MQSSFRPLSRGLSFNIGVVVDSNFPTKVFVPFLGDFLSIFPTKAGNVTTAIMVFVPFLGDFLSIVVTDEDGKTVYTPCFRPLSRGLSFNTLLWRCWHRNSSFRPLSRGLSFNDERFPTKAGNVTTVFVPFLGDFLSIVVLAVDERFPTKAVFVPFLGDFLSIRKDRIYPVQREVEFSSPFSGTFFQSKAGNVTTAIIVVVFVPFLGDFLSIRPRG